MRRLGSCFSSCLLVLYVLCGQVSFSSRVPKNTQRPHYPTVIVYLEGRRREERKDQRKVCDRLLPVAQPSTRPGLLSGSTFKNMLHGLRLCVCGSELLMAFTWSAPDCLSVSSNPFWRLLFCYFGETQLHSSLWRKWCHDSNQSLCCN